MRYILFFLSFMMSLNAMAINISSGRGALLYDAQSTTGPSGAQTNSPGHWKDNITAFNAGASGSKQISRLYPYSGDIEMNCTSPSDCVYSGANQNVYVYYASPAFGTDSVAAYRAAFPTALILAIIDGSTKSALLRPLSYTAVGVATADLAANVICADPNVDGVFFDLEPADMGVQGQFAFYKEIAKQFSSNVCIDSNHPNGRVFGVFINPNKVGDWGLVAAALGNNGFVAVSAYDIRDTNPPVPTSLLLYHSSVTGMLEIMDKASKLNKIPYTVVVPWAASFGEFNQYGLYDTSAPSDFKLIKDYTSEGITQLAYVQSARAMIMANCKSPYYLGMDGWSWTQYKSPKPKAGQLLLPVIPEGEVVEYLQKN